MNAFIHSFNTGNENIYYGWALACFSRYGVDLETTDLDYDYHYVLCVHQLAPGFEPLIWFHHGTSTWPSSPTMPTGCCCNQIATVESLALQQQLAGLPNLRALHLQQIDRTMQNPVCKVRVWEFNKCLPCAHACEAY